MFHVGPYAASLLLGPPDHTGTSAFLLVSFLVDPPAARPVVYPTAAARDRAQARSATPPSATSRCLRSSWRAGYRARARGVLRTGHGANALAAAVSVPLASVVRAATLHFGAYQMVAPKTRDLAAPAIAA